MSKLGKPIRKHDREFKLQAVQLALKGGRPIKQVSQDLGLHYSLLLKWIREFKQDSNDAFPGHGVLKPKDEAMYRLEKELALVKEERDILKNVTYTLGVCVPGSESWQVSNGSLRSVYAYR